MSLWILFSGFIPFLRKILRDFFFNECLLQTLDGVRFVSGLGSATLCRVNLRVDSKN